jgi:MerR family mercuric resistance operon transcriptional regulator
MKIGALAAQTGVNSSAIRYYERRGLIRPVRMLNGYRAYDNHALKTVAFVGQAQALGFTLNEIGEIVALARGGAHPCDKVRDLARRHVDGIDEKIRWLRAMRKELTALLKRDAPNGGGRLCPLISSARSSARNRSYTVTGRAR